MSEEQEDMKTFKAPRVEVTVTKQYNLSVAGKSLGTFSEVGELCGMKQLIAQDGNSVVIDCPNQFEEIIATLFSNRESESFKASVMKASPAIVAAMQKAIDEYKAKKEAPPEEETQEGESE